MASHVGGRTESLRALRDGRDLPRWITDSISGPFSTLAVPGWRPHGDSPLGGKANSELQVQASCLKGSLGDRSVFCAEAGGGRQQQWEEEAEKSHLQGPDAGACPLHVPRQTEQQRACFPLLSCTAQGALEQLCAIPGHRGELRLSEDSGGPGLGPPVLQGQVPRGQRNARSQAGCSLPSPCLLCDMGQQCCARWPMQPFQDRSS